MVGAQPGSVPGVQLVDVADLDAQVQRYLGDPGPVWTPTHLTVDGQHVIVSLYFRAL